MIDHLLAGGAGRERHRGELDVVVGYVKAPGNPAVVLVAELVW